MLLRRSLKSSVNPFKFLQQKVLPLLVGLILVVFIYNLFVIRQIRCTYNDGDCPENISEKLKTRLGSNAIFINQKSLSSSIESLYPIKEVHLSFHLFNSLRVTLTGSGLPYNTKVYLVQNLPLLAMDAASGSTLSADWPRPTTEIERSLLGQEGINFDLWDNGTLTPSATGEAKIIYLFKEKPDQDTLTNLFKLIKIVSHYLDFTQIYVLDHRVFLMQTNQPDIIIYVPFDEGSLVEALQSFAYLATIKKDAKVVDLRFKNPIIR